MQKKVVLIIGAFASPGVVDGIARAWSLADRAKREGGVAFAPCLDRRHGVEEPQIEEVRAVERAAIMRKFPDAVWFVDRDAADSADMLALARQYHYEIPLCQEAATEAAA